MILSTMLKSNYSDINYWAKLCKENINEAFDNQLYDKLVDLIEEATEILFELRDKQQLDKKEEELLKACDNFLV